MSRYPHTPKVRLYIPILSKTMNNLAKLSHIHMRSQSWATLTRHMKAYLVSAQLLVHSLERRWPNLTALLNVTRANTNAVEVGLLCLLSTAMALLAVSGLFRY